MNHIETRFLFLTVLCSAVLRPHYSAQAQDNFWQPSGLNSIYVQSLAINPTTGYIYAGTSGSGAYRSTNGGNSWEAAGVSDNDVLSVGTLRASGSAQFVFAGTYLSGVHRSTDHGASWSYSNGGTVLAFAANSLGHTFSGSLDQGIFRSTNQGQSWQPVNNSLTTFNVRTLAIDSNDVIFCGTLAGVFRSTNNGTSWTQASNGLTNTRIYALTFGAGGYLFAGSMGGGCFRSSNAGGTWTPISVGLTNAFVAALASNRRGHIFVGTTSGGAFLSTDNGEHWTEINTGLTSTMARTFAVDNNGFVFVGTPAGLFRSVQSTTNISGDDGGLPVAFELDQNYPNPFNPETRIGYKMPAAAFVSLKVYDVAGREVATLVNEEKQPGMYSVQLSAEGGSASDGEGTNLSSGVYFYTLRSGGYSSSKKMLLIK